MTRVAGGLLAAALLAGCGAPAWVGKGAAAFPPSEKRLYGVGKADAAIEGETLRREAADNRARADLQRTFDGFSGYLTEQDAGLAREIKSVGAGRLSGARIVERYRKGDEFYSLAELDLDEFRRTLKNAPELTARARAYIQDGSEKLLERMRADELKPGAGK